MWDERVLRLIFYFSISCFNLIGNKLHEFSLESVLSGTVIAD